MTRIFTAAVLFFLALFFVALPGGGEADAGPFFRRPLLRPLMDHSCGPSGCPSASKTFPTATTPSPAFREADTPVQQPWLLSEQTDDTSSPQPDTALDPLPGTGSRLPIGGKVPDKITHTLSPEILAALQELLRASSRPSQPVSISLPVEAETSQRLSRILMILEALSWLGLGTGGLLSGGKLIPLAARLVAGLQFALRDGSPASATTPAAPSSPPASK